MSVFTSTKTVSSPITLTHSHGTDIGSFRPKSPKKRSLPLKIKEIILPLDSSISMSDTSPSLAPSIIYIISFS